MKKKTRQGKKLAALLLAAVLALPNAAGAAAADPELEDDEVTIDDTAVMQHKEKNIKVAAKKDNRVMLYRNAKNQVRVYVCPTEKAPAIYKISGNRLKKDKKDPMLTLTKRRKRTKPYGDYGTPIWNKTRTAFYTDHFNTIYKCSKNGKILKKGNVLKKLGLDSDDYWMRGIRKVDKEIFAVSVMNTYDDSEKLYLYDMKKNKVKKKYEMKYQRLLGVTKTSVYLLSYDDEEPYEIVKLDVKTGKVEASIKAESMVCRKTEEVVGTMYNDDLYLCNEKGIFMWDEDLGVYDQLLDGTHSFRAGKDPYDILFTADDEVLITTEGNKLYRYRMSIG